MKWKTLLKALVFIGGFCIGFFAPTWYIVVIVFIALVILYVILMDEDKDRISNDEDEEGKK
jgi:uncharacterized membrane protein